MKENLVIFEQEEDSRSIIEGYISETELFITEKIFSDYNEGVKYAKINKPKVIIFSMLSDKELSFKIIKKLAEYGSNIIVLSEDYTTSNIIKTLRYGAKDFVSKPVLKKDLLVALDKCIQNNAKTLKKSQIISVYSNKGGVGKTALATNLAIEITRLTRDKVVLVDLNLPLGDVTTFLDLKTGVEISDFITNSKDKDDNFIIDACSRYKDTNLYILAEPPYIEKNHKLSPKQIIELFNILRKSFSYIVIDLGTNVDKLNITILENSDIILLTTIVNLPLIRNCQRCIDLFNNLNFPKDKIKIVVNRYLDNDEITIDDVEKTLSKKVYWKIPNNYFTIMSSINKGIPVSEVNENSNITESFMGLASKITEDLFEADLK